MGARTKWPEVFPMKNATSQATINEQIVLDNEPQFTSAEFKHFQMRHVCTSPYHPCSNGEGECFVRMLKSAIGKEDIGLDHLKR
ncbi:hypothetical protein J437_LFUL012710 [Ladona fulva]|uniref:Integrase catalytic domain-containing protein n=1 Tax=Ladona fulva TaxID=123851 RepID=A0A8K0KDS8_LADFU|nr:hypothetical protein J437_LFUL012710 [Ladona fulva]